MSERRLKILVSAYACSPYHGSEPGMGWGFVRALARHHDLWVLTEQREFEADIERYGETAPQLFEHVHFVFIPCPAHHGWLEKLWPPLYYRTYRQWQQLAYERALALHREIHFDLVHQLNMVGFREPGYLWQMAELPFVWGPIGGMDNTPWRMLPALGWYGGLFFGLRNAINSCQRRWQRRPRMAAQRPNTALIAATPSTQKLIRNLWQRESTVLCEVGTEMITEAMSVARADGTPLELVWSGLHIPRKGLNLLLRALALLPPELNYRVHILGDGPQNRPWRQLAQQLKLTEKCVWYGRVDRAQALRVMAGKHLFCVTSMYDLTSTVVPEAFSLGLPVICPDLFGFSAAVDDRCGIRIAANRSDEFIADYAAAIRRLYDNELERRALSRGAIARAKDFSWDKKLAALETIYATLQNDSVRS